MEMLMQCETTGQCTFDISIDLQIQRTAIIAEKCTSRRCMICLLFISCSNKVDFRCYVRRGYIKQSNEDCAAIPKEIPRHREEQERRRREDELRQAGHNAVSDSSTLIMVTPHVHLTFSWTLNRHRRRRT